MIVKKSPINQGFWHFDIVNLFTKRVIKSTFFWTLRRPVLPRQILNYI